MGSVLGGLAAVAVVLFLGIQLFLNEYNQLLGWWAVLTFVGIIASMITAYRLVRLGRFRSCWCAFSIAVVAGWVVAFLWFWLTA